MITLNNRYLTTAEAAEYTKFRHQTIYDYVNARKIPFIKTHRKVLFTTFELDLWLNNGATGEVAAVIMKNRHNIAKVVLQAIENGVWTADMDNLIAETIARGATDGI